MICGATFLAAISYFALREPKPTVWFTGQQAGKFAFAKELDSVRTLSNQTLRDRLLSFTPQGTPASNVLGFVAGNFSTQSFLFIHAYPAYVDCWQAHHGVPLLINPTMQDAPSRTIEAELACYSDRVFMGAFVRAKWIFDNADVLTDVQIQRYHH